MLVPEPKLKNNQGKSKREREREREINIKIDDKIIRACSGTRAAITLSRLIIFCVLTKLKMVTTISLYNITSGSLCTLTDIDIRYAGVSNEMLVFLGDLFLHYEA